MKFMEDVEKFRSSLIKKFEDLKTKATNLKDMIYLDGVIAIIETHNFNEENK